jgi:fluoride ion exporter CrcB/FEX
MLGLVVMMVLVVLFPWEIFRANGGQIYTDEVRLIVVTAIIGSLSTIGAFWLGSSFASRQPPPALGTRSRSTDL